MTRPAASCPNCSGPLSFAWSGSVQTVCPHCRSIVVRHDLDLTRVGEVSDPPPDTSLIQIGTAGRIDNRAFTVIGRIVYEYDGGVWSEWHLLFADNQTGWLSDAQRRYAIYSRVKETVRAPRAADLRVGTNVQIRGDAFEVATITDARYRGTEGELPFESWDRTISRFADFYSSGPALATIDYTEEPPAVYVGRSTSFAELTLRNLREIDPATIVPVGALSCRNCGAPLVIRAPGQSQSVVCGNCGSIADATDPNVGILQAARRRDTIVPTIPLGTNGDWRGARYEVVGFQRRSIDVDGVTYSWDEYVLFNAKEGFRYLSEYDGHWTDITVLDKRPSDLGERFRHFQSAKARTVFVLGEFPWIVKVGETVKVNDYVAPPQLLSCEGTASEETWSLGNYVKGDAIWRAFSLEGQPPRAVGVYANQPSPYLEIGWPLWRWFAACAALILVAALVREATSGRSIFSGRYHHDPAATGAAFVTDPFVLDGRPSNVDISVGTNLSNNWLHLGLALINQDTNTALDFDRELEYYFGVEEGESWSEGSRRGRIVVPTVPAGRYYLRIEPESDSASPVGIDYTIEVRRDRPVWMLYGVALVLLALPPLFVTWRHAAFERARWNESDYGGGSGADDEDDD